LHCPEFVLDVQAQEYECSRILARGIILVVARSEGIPAVAYDGAYAISSHVCPGLVQVSLSMALGSPGLSAITWTSLHMNNHSCEDPKKSVDLNVFSTNLSETHT
jgi:hypothetical protein